MLENTEQDSSRRRPPPACPFTLTLMQTTVPGLVAGGSASAMSSVAGPCLEEKCAIYDTQEKACSILGLGRRLDLLNFSLHRSAEAAELTAGALGATLGAGGAT